MTVRAAEADGRMDELLAETASSHEPIQIVGAHAAGVLVSEDDWRGIQETLHLLSIPGMRETLLAAAAEPIGECSKEPGW